MLIRLTHLDGKLPNVALLKISAVHKAWGDTVRLERVPYRLFGEPEYDRVYGSAIFTKSLGKVGQLLATWPDAIVGGTGTGLTRTVEDVLPGAANVKPDYSIYPDFPYSLGFTSRGCRLHCGFCMVHVLEGQIHSVATVYDVWRTGTPKRVILLDNDFFGQDEWQARCKEIMSGDFEVSLCQGINVRRITDEQAAWLVRIKVRDTAFKKRRLYVAWDNLKEEATFFTGVDRLLAAGFPKRALMVYMLIGFAKGETMEEVIYRYCKIKEAGLMPYPMIWGDRPDLKAFQRWVIRRFDAVVPWEDYRSRASTVARSGVMQLGISGVGQSGASYVEA